jgi:hypothetical protein
MFDRGVALNVVVVIVRHSYLTYNETESIDNLTVLEILSVFFRNKEIQKSVLFHKLGSVPP